MRGRRLIVVLLIASAALGCTSPEATRTRGRGPGADVGNHRGGEVELHAGARMYYGTPTNGDGIGQHALIIGTAESGQE